MTVVERDATEHRIDIKASGMEQRGKGSATALITAWVESAGDTTTKVRFKQDITVSGAVAQFSRGMMSDVSGKLTKQFADCLKTNITAQQEAVEAAAAAAPAAPATEADTGSEPAVSVAAAGQAAGDQPNPGRVAHGAVGGIAGAGAGGRRRLPPDRRIVAPSGAVAQFSRGMMQDVSTKLTKSFADCLKTNITAEQEAVEAAGRRPAGRRGLRAAAGSASGSAESAAAADDLPAERRRVPLARGVVGCGSCCVEAPARPGRHREVHRRNPPGLWAFWRAIVRFFQRLFGRKPKE